MSARLVRHLAASMLLLPAASWAQPARTIATGEHVRSASNARVEFVRFAGAAGALITTFYDSQRDAELAMYDAAGARMVTTDRSMMNVILPRTGIYLLGVARTDSMTPFTITVISDIASPENALFASGIGYVERSRADGHAIAYTCWTTPGREFARFDLATRRLATGFTRSADPRPPRRLDTEDPYEGTAVRLGEFSRYLCSDSATTAASAPADARVPDARPATARLVSYRNRFGTLHELRFDGESWWLQLGDSPERELAGGTAIERVNGVRGYVLAHPAWGESWFIPVAGSPRPRVCHRERRQRAWDCSAAMTELPPR